MKTKSMIAFHGKQKVKNKYVARLMAHHKADEIIQGEGWNGSRGCAVGCTLDNYKHKAYETELGIPEGLARLEDRIFEGLPKEKAPLFAIDFLTSINVGANLAPIKWKFCAFLLRENIERVLLLRIDDKLKEEVVTAIKGVLELHETAAKTGKWADSAADSAAWSAAESAAYGRYAKELIRILKETKGPAMPTKNKQAWKPSPSWRGNSK